MDKYVIENGEWKTKTAQTEPEYDDAGWFSSNGSALRNLSVEGAEKYMVLAYGENFQGEGPWIQYLRNTIKIFQYLDEDYAYNINALIEDLEEVREFNISLLNEMKAKQDVSAGEMGPFNPPGSKPAKSGKGKPAVNSSKGKGRSQRVPNF